MLRKLRLVRKNFFVVQKLMDKQMIGDTAFYHVKWQGYPISDATWEPICNLRNCLDLVWSFEKSLKNGPQQQQKARKEDTEDSYQVPAKVKNKKVQQPRQQQPKQPPKQPQQQPMKPPNTRSQRTVSPRLRSSSPRIRKRVKFADEDI